MEDHAGSPQPPPENEADHSEINPIWTTSRTARQIYALGEVEKDISRLLFLAASSISLLTLPQTDLPEDGLPQGEERSEQFVLEVGEYFERLDAIQSAIRSSLAHVKHSRIAPSAINAPPPGFVPPSLGVGLPSVDDANMDDGQKSNAGLQEERLGRDAWEGILAALKKIEAGHEAEESGVRGEGDKMEE
ncbi:hypothetical protein BDV98DRAFT_558907 [Pterulicium gracile]|uniref:Uncharacterized protein n=1 Tax=Pterulicium gracile TaxID=1884261 RepID=A0A5C3QXP6_9AGAR|nr:hypothetical protein BDV98DRAFT_558907 [Pterula gracilis]